MSPVCRFVSHLVDLTSGLTFVRFGPQREHLILFHTVLLVAHSIQNEVLQSFVCPSALHYVCLSVSQCICLFVSLSVCLSVFPSVHLSVSLSFFSSFRPPASLTLSFCSEQSGKELAHTVLLYSYYVNFEIF